MIRYSRYAEETPRERSERHVHTAMFWFGLLLLATMVHGVHKMITPFRTLPTTQARVVSAYRVRDFTELEYVVEGEAISSGSKTAVSSSPMESKQPLPMIQISRIKSTR